jgi:hypothetical protein
MVVISLLMIFESWPVPWDRPAGSTRADVVLLANGVEHRLPGGECPLVKLAACTCLANPQPKKFGLVYATVTSRIDSVDDDFDQCPGAVAKPVDRPVEHVSHVHQ